MRGDSKMINHIKTVFKDKFMVKPSKVYFAPGRVNIIGGHTDYNGGNVLPFCIDKGLFAAVSNTDDLKIRIFSENFNLEGIISVDLTATKYEKKDRYSDYLLGIIKELQVFNLHLDHGLNITLSSNLPVGGGLSSSAALCMLLLEIINDEFDFGLERLERVKLAKKVENDFIGVNCGIMDQFVIGYGKKDKAVFLNAKTLDFEYVDLLLDDYSFILINSQLSRTLKGSKYNDRQKETNEALKILQKTFNLDYLCDLELKDLDKALTLLGDNILRKRVKHVITESNRVVKAKHALNDHDYESLGKLLTEAHYSAKDDYEISAPTLDKMVDLALENKALGAKMIGGGFGGSILVLVSDDEIDDFIENYQKSFVKEFGKKFIYNIVNAGTGVKLID
jgi:galactokinase